MQPKGCPGLVPIAVIKRWSGRDVSNIRKACRAGRLKAYNLGGGGWLIEKHSARQWVRKA